MRLFSFGTVPKCRRFNGTAPSVVNLREYSPGFTIDSWTKSFYNNNLYFKRVTPITMKYSTKWPSKNKIDIINYNNHNKNRIYK